MDSDLKVKDVLENFYKAQAFPEDGSTAKWFQVSYGPLKVFYPNPKKRRDLIKYHDLTHILTGYKTTWTGEGEIAAWELASGFTAKHWAGYLYSPLTLIVGIFISPRRVYKAFRRGLGQKNIYKLTMSISEIEDMQWADFKSLMN